MYDSYGFGNEHSISDNNVTKVNVEGIAGNALSGIMKALDKQAILMDQLRRGIEDAGDELGTLGGNLDDIGSLNRKQAEDDRKEKKSEITRSVASERRQRAANQAVFGKIDKAMSAIDVLKSSLVDILDKIKSLIADGFKRSLSAFSDLSKSMRQQKLTSAQKKELGMAASDAVGSQNTFNESTGINVSRKASNEALLALTQAGRSIGNMSKTAKDAYVALHSLGASEEEAYAKATTLSKEQLEKEILARSDYQISGVISSLNSKITYNEKTRYGSVDEASDQILDAARGFAKEVGGFMSNDSIAAASKMFLDLKHGNIAGQSELGKAALTVFGKSIEDIKTLGPEEIAKSMRENLEAAAGDDRKFEEIKKQLYILERNNVVDSKLLGEMQLGLDQARSGNQAAMGRAVRDEQGNIEGLSRNTDEGKVFQVFDNLMAKLDKATGGLVTGMSNGLDEYFGDAFTIDDIVSRGFKLVCTLLSTIVASKIIGSPLSLITKAIGGAAIFGKVKGFFSRDKGENNDLPEVPKVKKVPKVPRDLDAEYDEAVKKLKEFPDYAKKHIKESFDKFKLSAKESFDKFKLSAKEGFDKFKSSTKNTFNSIKDSFHKAPGIIKDTFSDIKKRGVIAMTKIPGMFKGMGSKIGAGAAKFGKGALAGIGIASGVLGLLGSTGAFDSLTPIFEDFSKTIAPAIQDLVKSLAPILDGILKAIAPVLTKILQSLTPVLDSLFKTLTPVLDSVFKVLTPVIDSLVQTVMPVFSTIIETLMPIVTTVLDVLSPILKTIIDTIGPVIKIIANVATPILKVIGSVLKSISPILEFALKPISFALKLITAPLQHIADLLGKKDKLSEDTSGINVALEQAKEKGNTEYERKALFVKNAVAKGVAMDKQRDKESEEDWVLRNYERMSKGERTGFGEWLSDSFSASGTDAWDRIRKEAAANKDKSSEELRKEMLNTLKTAIEKNEEFSQDYAGDDFAGIDIDDWKKMGDDELYNNLSDKFDDPKLLKEAIKLLVSEDRANRIIKRQKLASGGVFSSATAATVGEAGKEAVVPLERPDDMKRVLNSLSPYEKFKLLKALISKNTKNITWDILADALLYTLGVGKSSGSAPGKVNVTELSNRIIEGAAAQKGHSYTEMVCNQMVEAALKYAGFKPPTTGVVTKHFNHPSMHLVLNDPVNGISPNNPALVPGMIMFSHPFTQAEADQLNKQKGGRRKAGDPGHMGIYAGNGLWWNSTSSKKFKDYSTGKAIDSTASGVALTKPFTTGTYKLYAAGYYDGMFDSTVSLPTAPTPSSSMINALNQTANKNQSDLTTNAKSTIKKAGLLTDEELNNIAKEAGIQNASAMSEFVKQAELILNSNKDKDSIVAILLDIAKYLRGVVTSSKPTVPVARPVAAMYG